MPDNEEYLLAATGRTPWNKGKLIGAKPPLRPNGSPESDLILSFSAPIPSGGRRRR
jgi:hypothetical protein